MGSASQTEIPYPIPLGGLKTVGLGPKWDGTPIPTSPFSPGAHAGGAQVAKNISFTADGGMYCRLGYVQDNSFGGAAAAVTITSGDRPALVYDFRLRDTTTRRTVLATRQRIWGSIPAGGTGFTALKTGLTADKYVGAVTFQNKCILTNGKDTPQVWDGTATTTSNLIQKIWSTHAALPVAQSSGACWTVRGDPDERVHLACGKTGAGTYRGLHQELDPVLGSWSTLPTGPAVQQTDGEGLLTSGFVFGGAASATTHTAAGWKWDDALRTWTATASMIAAKHGHACFVAGTADSLNVYECGGSVDVPASTTQSATTNRYDDVLNSWTTRGALNTARRALSAFELLGGGVSCGGMTGAGPAYSAVTEFYDPTANAWTAKTSMVTARSRLGSAPGFNGLGYAVGGTTGSDSAKAEEFDGTANTWTDLTGTGQPLTAARDDIRCCLSGKYVYAPGGQSSGTAQTTVYRLNTSPQPPVCRYACVHRDRLFMWGDPLAPSTLYYFDVGEFDSWDPRYRMLLDRDDGDWATAIFEFRDTLYAMKRDGGWRITGRRFHPSPSIGDQSKERICERGPVNQESVVVTEHGVFWRSENGFDRFDGVTPVNISRHGWSDRNANVVWSTGPVGVWSDWSEEVRWYSGQADTIGSVGYFASAIYHVPTGKWSQHDIGGGPFVQGPVVGNIERTPWDIAQPFMLGMLSATTIRLYQMDQLALDNQGVSGEAAVEATWMSTPFAPGGVLDQVQATRLIVESTGPCPGGLRAQLAADDVGANPAPSKPMTVPSGAGVAVYRYEWEQPGKNGYCFKVALRWDAVSLYTGGLQSPPVIKNPVLYVDILGGGRK